MSDQEPQPPMTELTAIAPNVQELQSSYDLLTKLNLVLLIVAGAVALAIALVSVLSTRRGNELVRAKDEQLTRDLKDKDEQIAANNKEAKRIETEAQERTAEVEAGAKKDAEEVRAAAEKQIAEVRAGADKEIAALNAEAEKAREGIATAHAEAEKANAEAARANQRAEELAKQNTLLQTRVGSEIWTRRLIEEAIAPRKIERYDAEGLRRFEGTEVEIICLDDTEAKRLMRQLVDLLPSVGWNVVSVRTVEDTTPFQLIDDAGVKMEITPNPRVITSPLFPAAEALVKMFGDNNIFAVTLWATEQLPVQRLRVIIGFRPRYSNVLRKTEELRRQLGLPPPMP